MSRGAVYIVQALQVVILWLAAVCALRLTLPDLLLHWDSFYPAGRVIVLVTAAVMAGVAVTASLCAVLLTSAWRRGE